MAPRPSVASGAALIVAAFACVAAMSALAKQAGDVHAPVLAFSQSLVSLALLGPWALRGGVSGLKTKRFFLHLLRAVAGLASQFLMFVAVKKMPLVDAVLLANSAPLFIPLIARVWLKTPVRGAVALGLVLGFVGVVLVLRPSEALLKNPSALLAVAAAVCSAFALVSVNQLTRSEPPARVLFYYFAISSGVAAPFALGTWVSLSALKWGMLGGIGALMAASQWLILQAYRRASAGRIAAFNYSVVLFSGLIGWVVWRDVPGWWALLGLALVVLGGVVSTVFGGHLAGRTLAARGPLPSASGAEP